MIRAIAIAAIFLVSAAQAQALDPQVCAPRTAVIQRLADKHGETPRGRGLNQTGTAMVELTTSDAGTWTILLSKPDGTTCLIVSGRYWEAVAAPKPGEPS